MSRGQINVLFAVICMMACAITAAVFGAEVEGNALRVKRAKEARAYSVRVVSRLANVFDPSSFVQGHGTGFVVERDAEYLYIFTNEHVVAKSHLQAQKLVVEFANPKGATKRAEAEVAYHSRSNDFAVVKVRLKDLPATIGKSLAKLPDGSIEDLVEPGRAGMAYGNPLDGRNVSTFGNVASTLTTSGSQLVIQTEAAINPGNSGGPFVDLESGKVVGINSLKNIAAEGMGFFIPIDILIEEWRAYKSDPQYGRRAVPYTGYGGISTEALALPAFQELRELVVKDIPDYFAKYDRLTYVTDIWRADDPQNELEVGDYVLRINGEVIGGKIDRALGLLRNVKGDVVEFRVIRHNQILEVKVPVSNMKREHDRREANHILLSGMLLQDLKSQERESMMRGEGGVLVTQVLEGSPAQRMAKMIPFSVVTGIKTSEGTVPIQNLGDVRRALSIMKKGEIVQVISRVPMISSKGHIVYRNGFPALMPDNTVDFLPVEYALTHKQLSLHDLRDKFDFSGSSSMDWRMHVKQCSVGLSELGPRSLPI